MDRYILFIKNEKTKNYRLISQLIVFFNLLAFVFILLQNELAIRDNIWLFFSIIVTAFYTFFAVVERIKKKSMPDFWHRSVLLYCAIAWSRTETWWIAILIIFFIGLDYLALKKQVVRISDKRISVPAFLDKKVEWKDLNNIILKDGLLTVDFKNNILFQHLILNSDWDIEEKDFNEYCRIKLKESDQK